MIKTIKDHFVSLLFTGLIAVGGILYTIVIKPHLFPNWLVHEIDKKEQSASFKITLLAKSTNTKLLVNFHFEIDPNAFEVKWNDLNLPSYCVINPEKPVTYFALESTSSEKPCIEIRTTITVKATATRTGASANFDSTTVKLTSSDGDLGKERSLAEGEVSEASPLNILLLVGIPLASIVIIFLGFLLIPLRRRKLRLLEAQKRFLDMHIGDQILFACQGIRDLKPESFSLFDLLLDKSHLIKTISKIAPAKLVNEKIDDWDGVEYLYNEFRRKYTEELVQLRYVYLSLEVARKQAKKQLEEFCRGITNKSTP
jgi:hypothetical protein